MQKASKLKNKKQSIVLKTKTLTIIVDYNGFSQKKSIILHKKTIKLFKLPLMSDYIDTKLIIKNPL